MRNKEYTNRKNIWKYDLYYISICILILFLLLISNFLVFGDTDKSDKDAIKQYNNGICKKCNTKWHYKDAYYRGTVGSRYVFECENGHLVELTKLPE